MSEILEIPQVIFRVGQEISIPQNNLIVPSAKYYYVNPNGDKIPVSNMGTPEERNLSLRIWYAMKSDNMFPLLTTYAKSRDDQVGVSEDDRPGSEIALSMKGQIRQYNDDNDWIYSDRFQLIIGQCKRKSIEDLIGDFYKFPLNPSADSFTVARLLEDYIRSGDEKELRKYLADLGIVHLVNHPFSYYPIYYLFFLLTRFASYPMTEVQLVLANTRLRTKFNSPERVFIDAIFDYEIYNLNQALQIIDQIDSGRTLFKTNNPDWTRWANEYLMNMNKPAQEIENLANVNYIVAEKLYTWTDIQIEELCNQLKLKLPFGSEYPTRFAYVADIACKIGRYKANPSGAALWKKQVLEKNETCCS